MKDKNKKHYLFQASAEKAHKALIASMNDINKKVEKDILNLGDVEASKKRIAVENADLLRNLQELQNSANLLLSNKSALVASLEEQKSVANNEAKERVSLLSKFRNLEHEIDGLKQNFDEEVAYN